MLKFLGVLAGLATCVYLMAVCCQQLAFMLLKPEACHYVFYGLIQWCSL